MKVDLRRSQTFIQKNNKNTIKKKNDKQLQQPRAREAKQVGRRVVDEMRYFAPMDSWGAGEHSRPVHG